MSTRSYEAQASHRDLDSEFGRLRIQATAGWKKELRTLRQAGLLDGMSILELGSGPGFVTEKLLEAFPTARITAVELDATLADQAAARLSKPAGDRLRIVNASLMASGLPDDHFDFAIARLVFQHLPDPLAAAREIRRQLRPGGRLTIIDSDDALWGLTEPAIPTMGNVLDDYGRAQSACGGNRCIGRALWRIIESAGFVNLELEAIVNHSDELGLDTLVPHLDPDRLLPLVQSGWTTLETVQAFEASLATFTAAPRPLMLMLMLMASGQKP